MKIIHRLKNRLRAWALEQLLKETGVDLSPDYIWATLNKAEEDIVLANLYDNKMFLSLMRKYAEIANKKMVMKAVMNEQYWKLRGEFFCYNNILIKSKRAKERANESKRDTNQT